jgi:hypothetical protein
MEQAFKSAEKHIIVHNSSGYDGQFELNVFEGVSQK